MTSVRLYCIPHAGATSSVYRSWPDQVPPGVEVVGLDPPGRGARAREKPAADYSTLVEALAGHVIADLERTGCPAYATFGHSFGAMLALAVAARAAEATGAAPAGAVLSASLPPRLLPVPDELATLSDEELLAKMAADGGTAPELLSSGAMAGYLLRLLRQDLTIRPEFRAHALLRVDFPLVLVAAKEDAYVPPEQMWAWAEHSTASVRCVEIPGGHFAVLQHPREALAPLFREVVC
ncbi:thioesterase II family protein [Amycolatopsis silviterrae]|uniref:Thioesterase II family protein n=1 Tax=Amycolatopsis silviterrae TaxID=1656914 RepID=A0ABW5HJF5_9PSEU